MKKVTIMRMPMSVCVAAVILATVGLFHANIRGQTPNAQSDLVAEIVFDKEPRENGLVLTTRDGIRPVDITIAGKPETVWRSDRQYDRSQAWMRDVPLKVVGDRFRYGKMPICDIEAICYKEQQSNLELWADTKTGWRRVAGTFGANKNGWMTLRATLDDARFGGAGDGGIDLRILSANDLSVKSVRVRFYDQSANVDWPRLVKIDRIESPNDNLLLVHPNAPTTLRYHIANVAKKPLPVVGLWTLKDRQGNARQSFAYKGVLKPQTVTPLAYPVATKNLRYGVCDLSFTLRRADTNAVIVQRDSYVGVATPGKLPKAKAGEFLYGLDMQLGAPYNNPRLLAWTDWMGADILRHGFDTSDGSNIGEITDKLPIFQARGLRNMLMIDIPATDSADERARLFRERAEWAGQIAAKFPEITYYELGNEPDLEGFYRGLIADYITGMVQVRDAIKAANPKAVVMNGGLSFAGEGGDRRSREFLNLVPWDKLDAVAYHGHGPGAQAERAAYTRAVRAARDAGKTGKQFIETESGVAARTRPQEDMQARTAVQKLVYAQSVGMPFFHWFRLLMFEEDYGNLRAEQEPRPAVLSYRNTVQSLRGLRFVKMVETGQEGIEAYLFAQTNKGPRRALVLWHAKPDASADVALALGANTAAMGLRGTDMYGNPAASPVEMTKGGDVLATVREEPTFLTWKSNAPISAVRRAPERIVTPPSVAVVDGRGATNLSVLLKNPTAGAQDVLLQSVVGGKVAQGKPVSVRLPANGDVRVRVAIAATKATTGVVWPRQWGVFFDEGSSPEARRATLTNKMEDTRYVTPDADGRLDLAGASGQPIQERRRAVLMAEIISDRTQVVKMGASADYWMTWYANGKKIYDTIQTGNGSGYRYNDHVFDLPLRKGKNVVAAHVLSGSQGFQLVVGEPERIARDGNKKQDNRVLLSLTDAKTGALLGRRSVEFVRIVPVSPLVGDLSLLPKQASPDVRLQDFVTNLFDTEPDSSRWWKGASDLSMQAWLRTSDGGDMIVLVAVRDDIDAKDTAASADKMWMGDSVQIGLSRDGVAYNEYAIRGSDGQVYKHHREAGLPVGTLPTSDTTKDRTTEVTATTTRDNGVTLYKIAVSRTLVGDNPFFFNLLVNDNDGYGRKQFIELRPGLGATKEPFRWQQIVLPLTAVPNKQ